MFKTFVLLTGVLAGGYANAQTASAEQSETYLQTFQINCDLLVPSFMTGETSEEMAQIQKFEALYNREHCDQVTGLSFADAFAPRQAKESEFRRMTDSLKNVLQPYPRGEMLILNE